MFVKRLIASAIVVASVSGCASTPEAERPIPTSQIKAPEVSYYKESVSSLHYANAKPLIFAPDATASDKVFSVLGLPTFKAVSAKGVSATFMEQAIKEQVEQAISPVARQQSGSPGDLSRLSFTALGGGVGAAGLAFTMLDGGVRDPRTTFGYFVCFERKSEASNLTEATHICSTKLNKMLTDTMVKTTKVQEMEYAQHRKGYVTDGQRKTVEFDLWKVRVYAAEGFAPADRGGYESWIVAVPFSQNFASGIGKWIGAETGELDAAAAAKALGTHRPKDTVFYLPDGETPAAVY